MMANVKNSTAGRRPCATITSTPMRGDSSGTASDRLAVPPTVEDYQSWFITRAGRVKERRRRCVPKLQPYHLCSPSSQHIPSVSSKHTEKPILLC
ncbi:hypothetical protein KM043_013976 [Ampulex compressa]|nr:hypothetical protein KM043_013976 [Ampulex compressa]